MYEEKLENLKSLIKDYGSVAVAFSAGVDSTFLLKVAHDVLGNRCIALTGCSPSFPGREAEEAKAFCADNHIRQIFFASGELENEDYARNPKDRCYYCKSLLFRKMLKLTEENGFAVLAEGSNADDASDYRPGLKAIAELKVKSPLREAGLTKEEIRAFSKELGLNTWNKQSFACLASRIPYGDRITEEKLSMIDKAEQVLFELGFTNYRVRVHDQVARIEVAPDAFTKLIEPYVRETVVAKLKTYGFHYVAMDLAGYRTGSMNEVLKKD